jgi:hypothetical protein
MSSIGSAGILPAFLNFVECAEKLRDGLFFVAGGGDFQDG